MSRVYWDTQLFIYWLEDHPVHASRLELVRQRMEARGDLLCTSVYTLSEILVAPYRRGGAELAASIRERLRPPGVELLPFTEAVADRCAQLCGQQGVAAADAIHLATAAVAGVDLFLTHSQGLVGMAVPGVRFIAPLEANLF